MDRTRGRSRALLMIAALMVTSVAGPASAAAASQAPDPTAPASTGTSAASIDTHAPGVQTNPGPLEAKPLSLAGATHVGPIGKKKGAACDRPFRAQGLVDVLSPANGATIGAMPLVVRLRLSKSADPASLKVTLNRTRSIEHVFADCGGEMEARLYAMDLTSGKNVLRVAVRGVGHHRHRHEVVTVRFKNNDPLIADTAPIHRVPIGKVTDPYFWAIQTQTPITGGSGAGISVGWGAQATIYDSTAVGGTNQGYQVLLLDRATLAPVRNESLCMTFALNECAADQPITDYDSILKRLTDPGYYAGCLGAGCIVVIQALNGAMQNGNMGELFAQLGGTNSIQGVPSSTMVATQYSLVTSVGIAQGKLVFRDPGEGVEQINCFGGCVNPLVPGDTFDPDVNGAVAGYLALDSTGNYTYHRRGELVAFSTGDGSASNVMSVGSLTFPLTTAQGYDPNFPARSGFQAVVVNAVRPMLAQYPPQNTFFDSPGALATLLQGLSEADLLLLRSIGDVTGFSPPFPGLSAQIDRLGGFVNIWGSLGAGDDYSLVASPPPGSETGAKRARIAEASSLDARAALGPDKALPPSNLSGWLVRNNRGFLEPRRASATKTPLEQGIEAVAYSDLTPWPSPTTAGERFAYTHLSNAVLLGGQLLADADLRATYVDSTRDHNTDLTVLSGQAYGTTAGTLCNNDPLPDVPNIPSLSYTWKEFCHVFRDLSDELVWVADVWKLHDAYNGTFATFNTVGAGDLDVIYKAIDATTGFKDPKGPSPVLGVVLGLIEGALYTLSYFPEEAEIGQAMGVLAESIDVANQGISSSESGDPQPDVSTTWAKAEADLAHRFVALEDNMTTLFALIVSDRGKLSTVGRPLQAEDSTWAIPVLGDQNTKAWGQATEVNMMRGFYGNLLNAGFGTVKLAGIEGTSTTPPHPDDFFVCIEKPSDCRQGLQIRIFKKFGTLAVDSWAAVLEPGNTDVWDMYVLASMGMANEGPTIPQVKFAPTADLLAPLFKPLQAVGTTPTQLGLYRPRFLAQGSEPTLILQQGQCFGLNCP